MNYDVFISYRRRDIFKALIIYNELIACGLNVFLDISELRSGQYEDKIHQAISNSKVFIMIVKANTFINEDGHESWVCKETKWAMEKEKLILPILFEGYKWPNENHYGCEMEKEVSSYHSIGFSDEYQDASFQKIFHYLNENGCKVTKIHKNCISYSSHDIEIDEFVNVNMQYVDEICGLQLAFHAGTDWYQDYTTKYFTILKLIEKKVPIRILINTESAAESIGKHMRSDNFLYTSFKEAIQSWKKIATFFPGMIEIRVSDIPIIHCMCCFDMCCHHDSQMMIQYYTYGNNNPNKNFDALFNGKNAYFHLYKEEFEYLWKLAQPISQF